MDSTSYSGERYTLASLAAASKVRDTLPSNASTHDWTAFVHFGPFVSHSMSSSAAPSTWLPPWRMPERFAFT